LKKNGSGGGTRTPDTRIMIKLLKLFYFAKVTYEHIYQVC